MMATPCLSSPGLLSCPSLPSNSCVGQTCILLPMRLVLKLPCMMLTYFIGCKSNEHLSCMPWKPGLPWSEASVAMNMCTPTALPPLIKWCLIETVILRAEQSLCANAVLRSGSPILTMPPLDCKILTFRHTPGASGFRPCHCSRF
jgi:hypothetical protein